MRDAGAAAELTVASLTRELERIMALVDFDAARRFPERQRALDLIAQLTAAPGSRHLDPTRHRARLHAADDLLFDHVAHGIRLGRLRGHGLRRLLDRYTRYEPGDATSRLMGNDLADALWAGVGAYGAAPTANVSLTAEMVHLEHTPVRVVLALLDRWPRDLDRSAGLLDVGCGLGQVTHLVAALTGMPVRGVDIEPAYIQHARASAGHLGLENVALKACDAREADYAHEGMLFMFTPFVGDLLQEVLERMRSQTVGRRVYVASYGASSLALAEQAWLALTAETEIDPFRLCIFRRT